ncbi:MAG: carbohydrate kinase family protein [Methanimicrococcus sp.]|nr:carbohydrate kinase family protein [Methanimicrococcus sp.]
MSRIISVTGHTSLDFLLTVDSIVDKNQSAPILKYDINFGGGAANVAAAIACLGSHAQLISPIGNDFSSSGYEKQLSDFGVDLSLVYRMTDETLSKAFILTDCLSNQTTYFHWGAAAKLAGLTPPKVDFVHIATADCYFNAAMSQNASFVSFDPGQDSVTYKKEPLNTILENTDILFANRHEIQRVMNISEKAFEELKSMIPLIIVTYDKDGSILYENKGDFKETKIPAALVESVDPTGAGDAYKAGFLVAFTKGYAPKICCQIGSVTASFVVEKIGCQTNLPTWELMAERYSKYYPDSDLIL